MTQAQPAIYERTPVPTKHYTGSLEDHRGKAVTGVGDCYCPGCVTLDLWDMARRAVVLLEDGTRLECVRWSSLT